MVSVIRFGQDPQEYRVLTKLCFADCVALWIETRHCYFSLIIDQKLRQRKER